ncbi:nucleotidyltransferase domain-containing protein [Candidatus Aquicultor secundus]|uniref:Polymerase beta nucleotidyltransferase domain-containing protein n=1 Tax=Candidatus Aquicultor secundus TaxID=1973895 RepID=A0A2M7T8J7_9ACTN|nr:nucleotidyltransferase domain-containing protein [Candidatus Aquicultor secundus]PIU26621.1 MAG: hypothetical protein COT10_07745 [Candidatus Aquicultor secundus]PIZ39738.1 MAG: hypothetical protein COY37_04660 [Candidatus Aquicultor secundus]PJB78699.1 MAG: hypothetical protein CO091_04205 [Candidatus Aquicultor secundus]
MSNILEHKSNFRSRFFFTNYNKILAYLADHPSGEYTEKEIKEATGVSRAGANFALRELVEDGLAISQRRGRMAFYSVSLENPLIRQVKVLINLIKIDPLISDLKNISDKIILFGSSATGTNIEESDIDLFVLTNDPPEALSKASKFETAEKIQTIARKPIDYITLKKKDPIFYEEISHGLTLWEKK